MTYRHLFHPVPALLAISLLAPVAAHAEAAQQYAIAPGSLGDVLNAVASTANRPLTVAPGLIQGRTSGGVHGFLTAEQAMQQALVNTGLVLTVGKDGSMSVVAAAQRQSSSSLETTLPTVTVTAPASAVGSYQPTTAASPKFTAPLRDTPRTVAVVPQQVIEDTGSTSLQDVLRTMSGLTFAAGEGGVPLADRPAIRGINSTSNMLVDGLRDIGAQTREVFNLEQVEVSKGPDSVYFGRGGGGGSINMVSKKPRHENFITGELTASTANSLRGTVDANWELNDAAALRLNLLRDHGHVAGRDDAVYYDKRGIAPSLDLKLGRDTRLNLSYYHLEESGMPDYGIPVDPTTGAPIKGMNRHNFYGLANRDFRNTLTDIGTLALEHDLGGGFMLRNTTRGGSSTNSYLATAPNGASPLYAAINQPGTLQGSVFRQIKSQWTQTNTAANQTELFGELRTGSVRHSLNAGLEFSRERWNVDGWNASSANPLAANQTGSQPQCAAYASLYGSYDCTNLYAPNPHDAWTGSISRLDNPTYYRTTTRSAYVFDSMNLSERWLLNVGLRWDGYRTRSYKATGSIAEQSDDFLNYQLGVVYKPAPQASLYLSTASASTPAALGTSDYDKVTAKNSGLKPERSVTYELGAKWDVLDEKLSLTGALFTMDRKNASVQVDAITAEQIGRSRVRGLELGVAGNLTPAWKLYGGYTYLDSEITRGAYNDSSVGKPLPDAPKHSLSLWSSYQIDPAWQIGGGAYFMDKRYGTACARDCYAPAYWRFDAMAQWRINAQWQMRLNVQNLFNKLYYSKVHYFMGVPGAGRSAALTLVYSYR